MDFYQINYAFGVFFCVCVCVCVCVSVQEIKRGGVGLSTQFIWWFRIKSQYKCIILLLWNFWFESDFES